MVFLLLLVQFTNQSQSPHMPPTALECCPDAGQDAIKAFLSNPATKHSSDAQVLHSIVLPFYHRFENNNGLPSFQWVGGVMSNLSDMDQRSLLRVCTNPEFHLDLLEDLVLQYCAHLLESCGLEPQTQFNQLFQVELQDLIPELAVTPPSSPVEVFEMDA